MAKTAPSPVDVLDFQFKLQSRLKIFENDTHETFKKPCSLVTAASRYGLLFVGTSSPKFQVIEIQDIQSFTVKDGDVVGYRRRTVTLPSIPKYLGTNCDSTRLCVVVEKDGCIKALIYDVSSFLKQNVSILQQIRLSTIPGVNTIDLCWNPSVPSMLVACKDDGTLGLYDIRDNGIEIKELPKTAAATCICWSPKGKQIVVGSADGKLTQYKLDLQVAKVVGPPPINGNPYPISLQWISNYQFIAIYKTNGNDTQMSLMVVDAPKNAEPSYTNYDDVCYSYGNARPYQFYMLQQPLWNILLVASSNSMEVGIMHLEKDSWTQWILTDSARAELPLNAIKQDTLPVGMAFDVSSNKPVPWGENELPPAPYLFLLSHQGVMCCFHTLNLKEGAPKLCTPPEALPDRSGTIHFTMGEHQNVNPVQATPVMSLIKPTPVAQTTAPLQQPLPAFGMNITTQQSTIFGSPALMTSQKAPTPALFNKPVANAPSLFGTQTQPFATLKTESQPTMIAKPQVEVKKVENTPEIENNQKAVITKPSVISQQVKQTVVVEPKPTPAQKSAVSGIPAINEETEKLLAQMIKEECVNLDVEMKVLLSQGSNIKVDLGSDLEATSIVEGATALQDFLKEMNEISTTQAAEIHVLKQTLIQTWVWYEEARSRFATYKDPTLKSILLAQPLDAASERKLDEIRHLIYYLESQLVQANTALDEQWETFQDSCKKKLSAKVPNIEAIYQVMVKQNATLQRQVYVLKDISMRIRSKLKNINTPRLLVSLDNTGELEEQLRSLHMEPKDLVQIRYEKVLKRQKRLSKERVDKLKECFQNGNVSHVTVRKPLNNSFMQMSGLGVMPFSPIVPKKPLREERLDFVQSTPLPESIKTSNVPVESNPSPAVVVNLFKQEPKAVGSDVKTSAFVPMVNTKNTFFGTGHLDQNALYNQKAQKAAVENISKPPSFNLVPHTAAVTQKSSSSNFFGTIPVFGTTSKPVASELSNKVPISVPPSVSISLIKSSTNETQAAKSNAFTQFSMPSTQSFNFLMNKPGSNVTSGLPAEKASSVSEPEGTKTLFSSIFGQAAKNVDVVKLPSTNFGEKSIFAQDSAAAVGENKSFAIGKPAAFFGQVPQSSADPFKITSTPKITATHQIVTTTSSPNLFNQVFTSTGQSEAFPKIFGQIPSTTNSVFAPQSPLVTTSTFSLGQGIISSTPITTTSAININNQQISITTVQTLPAISTTTQTTSPITTRPSNEEIPTDNSSSQTVTTVLPTFGQLTTTGAVFGSTTTTSIFIQPVSTTKAATTTGTHSIPVISNSTTQPSNTTSSTSTMETSSPFAQVPSSASLFGQKPSGTGTATTTPVLGQPTTQTPSIFSKAASTFGQSTTAAMLGQTPSVFSSPTTTATVCVATTPFMPSVATAFVQNTTVPFAQSTTPFTQTTTSFVQSTPTPFLQSTTTTPFVQTITSTPFVQSPATTPFVQSTTAPFMQSTTMPFAQTTSTPAVFGQAVTSTTSSNLFTPATTSPTLFKQQATTSSSIFGQTTSAPSVFGQTTSTPTVFGQKTSTPSIFGQAALTQTSTPSIFGQTTTSSSIFGQTTSTPTAFGQTTSAPSIFGQAAFTQTSTQSIFGQPTSTPSIFGQPTSTPNIFGQPTSTPSVFGQTTSAPSVFGQPSMPPFGQTTSSAPIFGQQQQQQSVFGQPTTSAFGQTVTSASIFGQPTTSTPSIFGQNSFGNNSIFKTSTNVFGGTSPFAQTSTTTSVFGSSPPFGSSSVFGGNTTNNVFSKPSFGATDNLNFGALNTSSGPTTTSATVFGSSFNSFRTADKDQPFNTTNTIFESPSTTSTSSVFGNSPFSKSTPAFGGPATFGSTPTFSQPSGFGSTFASNANFGSTNQPGPFSAGGNTQTVSQSGFGSPAAFQKPAFINQSGFGSQPSGFGAPPTFGASTFGSSPTFGSPNRVFGNAEGFGAAPQQQNSTFANLANQQTIGFGSVAQQAPVENMQQPSFTGGSSFTSWR